MKPSHREPLPAALRDYQMWARFTRVTSWQMSRMRNEVPYLAYRPQISILLPVYNPRRRWLEQALDSVMSQTYPCWELCVCNDGSTEAHVEEILDLYERLDGRIRVKHLKSNVGIARATNEAFSLASTGEFVALMDHDDTLAPHALFEVVRFLQQHPDADLIYTDEDKIDEAANPIQPQFKPGWSPDLALGVNYLVHLSIYRRSILEEIGVCRQGLDGAQDFDLMLRYTERTDRIYRLPKVLYHWRMVEGSVAKSEHFKDYSYERARRAIQDALDRRNIPAKVLDGLMPNGFHIEREIEGKPKVSVVIPRREGADYIRCVASLQRHTTYPNYELLLLETGANNLETRALSERARVVEVSEALTPLEMYNVAFERVEGEYVLLLDPHLEALSEGWLEALLQHAQRAEVGAVGGKLVSNKEGHTCQAGLILNPEEREEMAQTFYRPYNRQHPGFRTFINMVRNCAAISGGCMMFGREVFEAAGGFDTEHLEDEFGDVDLCLRLREQGYLLVYTPYAEFVQHNPEPGGGLKPEQAGYVRERWAVALKNDPYYNPNLGWTASSDPLSMLEHSRRVSIRSSQSDGAAFKEAVQSVGGRSLVEGIG